MRGMRNGMWAVAMLLGCHWGSVAMACLPSRPYDPSYVEAMQERREKLKREAISAEDIVYGVVDSQIGSGSHMEEKIGTLRIIHSYKGSMKVGQKLQMLGGTDQYRAQCSFDTFFWRPGEYGVVVFRASQDKKIPYFSGFLPDDMVKELLEEGVIQSARQHAPSAAESKPVGPPK